MIIYNIEISEPAENDLRDIIHYITDDLIRGIKLMQNPEPQKDSGGSGFFCGGPAS
jgi:plasmid stabilization system protein ParE